MSRLHRSLLILSCFLGLTSRVKKQFFKIIRKIPFIGATVSILWFSTSLFSFRLLFLTHWSMIKSPLSCWRGKPLTHFHIMALWLFQGLRCVINLNRAQHVWFMVHKIIRVYDTFCFLSNLSLIRFKISSTRHWMTCQWVYARWRKAWATPNSCLCRASPTNSSLTRSESMRHWVSHLQPVLTPISYNGEKAQRLWG